MRVPGSAAIVIVLALPAAECLAQEKAVVAVSIFAQVATNSAKALTVVDNDKEALRLAEKTVEAGDECFRRLKDDKVLNDKLQAYEEAWLLLRQVLKEAPRRAGLATRLSEFTKNLELAAQGEKGGKCTVVVSASKGEGATIRYIKAADDALGGAYKDLGESTVVTELERAEYLFKSFRGDKQTGSTGRVDCTSKDKKVKVVIKE